MRKDAVDGFAGDARLGGVEVDEGDVSVDADVVQEGSTGTTTRSSKLASKVILAAVLLLMRREDAKASVVVNGSFIFCRREFVASVDDVAEELRLKDRLEDYCEECSLKRGRFVGFDRLL